MIIMIRMILTHFVFVAIPNVFVSVLGFVLVGIHMSMTQANNKSLISQKLEPHQRGAGFAAFSVISGLALAAGNTLAGWCNDRAMAKGLGMVGCFDSGFVWSSVSPVLLVLLLVYFAVHRDEKKETKKNTQGPWCIYNSTFYLNLGMGSQSLLRTGVCFNVWQRTTALSNIAFWFCKARNSSFLSLLVDGSTRIPFMKSLEFRLQ